MTGGWIWRFYAHPRQIEDTRWFEWRLRHEGRSATRQAAAAGYVLHGEWDLTQHPMVRVEDWNDEGPAMVSEALAREHGIDTPVTMVECRLEWSAAHQETIMAARRDTTPPRAPS